MTKAQKVLNWNERYPVGTDVIVTKDDGSEVATKTRSSAEILSGHTPVIWLQGIRGCYILERVRPNLSGSPQL